MKLIATLTATLILLSAARGQLQPNGPVVSSVSGQIFVNGSGPVSAQSLQLAVDPRMITLEPALLTVSCERIKQELLRQLDMQDRWKGKVFITLKQAGSADDPIPIVFRRFIRNWNCSIEMPNVVERNRFVVAVVRALLTEIASRNAGDTPAEVPEWMVQGFARQLLGSSEIKLILQPPSARENGLSVARMNVDVTDSPTGGGKPTRRMNPLVEAIETFRWSAPLTFEELSWPNDEQASSNASGAYGSSAQLFVSQLLRLPNGARSMQLMLVKLPDFLNWQFAFMEAFHAQFAKPLDVEKWWALELVQFTGRDLLHLWNRDESARQLDTLFRFPIDVKIGEGAPMRTDISVQTIIRGWSRTRQLQAIKKKLWELDMVRLRISPDFIPLVDDYRQVLQDYYNKRSASTKILPARNGVQDKMVEDAVQQLDQLDVRREAMRHPDLPMAATAEQPENPAPSVVLLPLK